MAVRFGQKFDTARLVELIEEFEHLGAVLFQQFDGRAGEGEGALEIVAVVVGHLDEGIEGGDVAVFGRLGDGALVFVVVVIVVVGADVEETIALEVDVLVDFEI